MATTCWLVAGRLSILYHWRQVCEVAGFVCDSGCIYMQTEIQNAESQLSLTILIYDNWNPLKTILILKLYRMLHFNKSTKHFSADSARDVGLGTLFSCLAWPLTWVLLPILEILKILEKNTATKIAVCYIFKHPQISIFYFIRFIYQGKSNSIKSWWWQSISINCPKR